ncbi:MAG: PspA/IM30 family protein [Lentisphaeraceae bacterium]|nr:PspA/IM30 family protein [Lentisphaeraceae bacterium]
MGIFKRIKDMVSANINDLLEKFEDPEHVIDQMIKEMEETIIDVRKQTASSIASSKITSKKLSDTEKDVEKWQKNAELAIMEGSDELAKKALTRRRELEAVLESLKKQLADEEEMIEKMKSDLHLVEEKVQEARRKRESLLMKKRAADAKKKMLESSEKARAAFDGSANSIINGFDSFDKYEEKIERELAEAEAREELNTNRKKTDLDAEFAHLQSDSEVEDELAALKKKLKKG